MKAIKNLIFLLVLTFSVSVISQEKEKKVDTKKSMNVSILVKDANNKPVPGAIILFDNVKQKRRTNIKGYFKIKLGKAPKEISAFSPRIGIKKVKYKNVNDIVITIKKGNNDLVKTSPKKKGLNSKQFLNIYDYLRGQVPGVNVNADNVITIRGHNSVNGSTQPLFILNNVQVSEGTFANIVPTNIKYVTVLKGPDTAIYGLRGANGVIKVVTL
ncbi:MAG: TonB-dependent receptor plug domain-containing protein [Flavobacteriaceae bacterium]